MDLDAMDRRLRNLEAKVASYEPMLEAALPGWLDDKLRRDEARVRALDAEREEERQAEEKRVAYEQEQAAAAQAEADARKETVPAGG